MSTTNLHFNIRDNRSRTVRSTNNAASIFRMAITEISLIFEAIWKIGNVISGPLSWHMVANQSHIKYMFLKTKMN